MEDNVIDSIKEATTAVRNPIYTQLVEDTEMLQDIRDVDEALQEIANGEEVIPAHVPYAIILDGENPVKVWREYREMTQQALAQAAGISASYLSQIETGKREGTTAVLHTPGHRPRHEFDVG